MAGNNEQFERTLKADPAPDLTRWSNVLRWNAQTWIKNRYDAHDVLQALNDPADGDSRVEKTYSENMRPLDFSIDTPGLTDVYTFQNLRDDLDEP